MEKFEVTNYWFELTCKNVQKDLILRLIACLGDFGLESFDIDILPLNDVSLTFIRFRIPVASVKRFVNIFTALRLHFSAYEEE